MRVLSLDERSDADSTQASTQESEVTKTIIDITDVKNSAFRGIDGLSSLRFDASILAADGYIKRRIRPRQLIVENDVTEYYSGSKALGQYKEELYLDSYPIQSITSVKENGTALVVGVGYDASNSFDVIRDDERGILIRRPGPTQVTVDLNAQLLTRQIRWAEGFQNIELTWKSGYADADSVPDELKEVAIELAVLIYRSGRQIGESNVSRQNHSASFEKDLSARSRQTLDSFIGWGRARCR